MAVESSAVQIRINVIDTNSSAAVAGVTGNLDRLGAAGAGAGSKTKEGLDKVGAAALSSKEKVRLMSEEFGVRVPRAMQSVIAKCPQLMGAIGALSGAMIALGAIQIGAMMFEAAIKGAEKLWNALTALPKSVRDYQAEVAKAREEDFGNTHSIETTRARIDEATEAVKRYQDAANAPQTGQGWRTSLDFLLPGAGDAWQHSHDRSTATGQQMEWQKKLDKLQHQNDSEQYHAGREGTIELLHAGDAAIKDPQKKHDAAIQEAKDRAAEERRYNNERDRMLGNPVPQNAGADKEKLAVQIATKKADAELANSQKQHTGDAKSQAAELARIHEQALESGLRGSALYHAQEAAAIEDLKRRGIASAQAVEDVHTKFHNEEMRRLEQQQDETAKIGREAAMAGMTGIQRTQTEGANRIADIHDRDFVDVDASGHSALAEKQRTAATQETNQQIAAEQRSFTEEIDTLADASAAHQVQGFARIRADATKELDGLQKKFDETYGRMDRSTPGGAAAYGQGLAQLHRGQGAIGAGEKSSEGELTQRNERETEQLEEQARVKYLSAEKQKTAAIVEELADRLAKYREELDAQQISQEDYDRRAAAAQQMANAQMVEAATEARRKMAGEFEGFFKGMEDPKRYMKELGDKAAGNAAATLWQRFQPGGNAGQNTSEHTSFFGDLKSGFGFGKKKTPDVAAAGHDAHNTAQGTFSVAQATIHIGSASFSGAGAPGGVAGAPGAVGVAGAGNSTTSASSWNPVAGSTSLLAPSGSVASTEAGAPTSASGSDWGSAASTVGGAGMTNLGMPLPGTSGAGGLAGGAGSSVSSYTGTSGAKVAGKMQQGLSLLKQGGGSGMTGALIGKLNDSDTASKMFGGKLFGSGSLFGKNKSGADSSESSGTGSAMGKVGGTASGVLGVYSASQGGGGVGGAVQGAMSGAQAGSAFGPAGMAVGAVVGGTLGFMGSSEQARVYDLKTVRPRISSDTQSYQQGGMDYLSAYSDLQSLQSEAFAATSAMGTAGRRYRNDHITPEIKQAEGKLSSQEKAGRSQYTATAASYATGTPNVPETGYNLNHAGERIFSAVDNQAITKAVTEGNQGTMPAQTQSMGDVHLHVHAIDAKSSVQFLQANKHAIRDVLNDSYAENSGGGL